MQLNNNIAAFLRNLTIGQKLIVSYLLLGSTVLVLLFYFYYYATKNAIIARTQNQMSSVMNLKKGWVESYFETQKIHIGHFATLYNTIFTFSELNSNFRKYGINSQRYHEADSIFGGNVLEFKLSNNFKNIWLVNNDGDIVYTSIKSGNLSQNVLDTHFYNPNLRLLFSKSQNETVVGDLPYLSVANKSAFVVILSPIKDYQYNTLGYILVKLNMDDINFILTQRSGLGKSGESYLVDHLYTMRSKSRFLEETELSQIKVSSEGVKKAFKYNNGMGIFPDYRQVMVLSCYSTLNISGLDWALLSEIDFSEALKPVDELFKLMVLIGIFISIGLILLTFYLSGQISNPIKKLNYSINQLAQGILPNEPIVHLSGDEIGQIAFSINQLVQALKKTADFAKQIGAGNFATAFTPLSQHDELGHALNEMRDQLVQLSHLITKQSRIKTLSLIEGQENERRRISRDLHDGVGQMLTALSFKIQEMDLKNPVVNATKKLLDETIHEVRRVSVNLMPSVLYDFGIEAAIKSLIKTVNIEIYFSAFKDNDASQPDLEKTICLYRIAQEAIQNIQKYANTDKARIDLEILNEKITLVIADSGTGFDVNFTLTHNLLSNGLRNMRERAQLVGGNFEVVSKRLNGTTVTVTIPQ